MWINLQTQQAESEAQIRASHPNTSYPTPMPDNIDSYAKLVQTPAPAAQPWCNVIQGNPAEIDGIWQTTWLQVPMSPSEVETYVVDRVQQRLDSFAQTRGYDGILSACTYAASAVAKFAAEGAYCIQQRDMTWAALYQLMAEVQAGTTPMPTDYAAIESYLPELTWPA